MEYQDQPRQHELHRKELILSSLNGHPLLSELIFYPKNFCGFQTHFQQIFLLTMACAQFRPKPNRQASSQQKLMLKILSLTLCPNFFQNFTTFLLNIPKRKCACEELKLSHCILCSKENLYMDYNQRNLLYLFLALYLQLLLILLLCLKLIV